MFNLNLSWDTQNPFSLILFSSELESTTSCERPLRKTDHTEQFEARASAATGKPNLEDLRQLLGSGGGQRHANES